MRRLVINVIGLAAVSTMAACDTLQTLPERAPRFIAQTANGCPGLGRVDATYATTRTERESREDRHAELRRRRNAPEPAGSNRIAVWVGGGHHSPTYGSVIATKGADGEWTVDYIAEVAPLSQGSPTEAARRRWTIAPTDARRLERLAEGPCPGLTPRLLTGDGCIAPIYNTLEMRYRRGRFAASQGCGRFGAVGEMLDIIWRGDEAA